MSAADTPYPTQLRFVQAYEYLRTKLKSKVGKISFKPTNTTIGNGTHLDGQFNTPITELSADLFITEAGISVPKVFYTMAEFVVRRGGRDLEGVFRTCGSKSRMGQIKDAINRNGRFPEHTTVPDMTGLMKQYLRDQPEALLGGVRELALDVFKKLDGKDRDIALIAVINLLPPRSFDLVVFLAKYLGQINETASKMGPTNLGLVFSENLFFGSSMSQETPTMDQMQESATFSKIVEALIRLNADLTKLPRKIQETNDGEDVDAVKQTFRMATAPKRKRRLSTKSSELLSNFGNKVGAVMGRMGRRKSINITDPALRPAGAANAPKLTQPDGQPARMSSAERQSVKRKSESIKVGGGNRATFGQDSEGFIKRRRQMSNRQPSTEHMNMSTTRRGTTYRSPMQTKSRPSTVRSKASKFAGRATTVVNASGLAMKSRQPGTSVNGRQQAFAVHRQQPFAVKSVKVGERGRTPTENTAPTNVPVKPTLKRRLSIRSRRPVPKSNDPLNTSVWSTLKLDNPDKGETILDVLTGKHNGPIIAADGAEVYMV